jgi:hypothetical protein
MPGKPSSAAVRAWTLGEFKGIAEKAARVATSYLPPGKWSSDFEF